LPSRTNCSNSSLTRPCMSAHSVQIYLDGSLGLMPAQITRFSWPTTTKGTQTSWNYVKSRAMNSFNGPLKTAEPPWNGSTAGFAPVLPHLSICRREPRRT
jgi:hypothetical protein